MTAPVAAPTRTLSLRAHLLLLVVGTMLPVLVVAAVLMRRVVADNRDAIERRLLETARAEAALVDAELGGTIRALQGLAQSDRLTNGEIPAFYAEARRLLPTQPTWSAINLAAPDGRQIAYTARPLGNPLPIVTDRVSFDRVLRTNAPAIGNLRVGQISRERGFVVRVPVMRDERMLYVVSAWITSDSFATVLRRQPAISDEWARGVVDAAGVVVARSRDADRFVGRQGTPALLEQLDAVDERVSRETTLDGVPVYGAFSRAPVSGWIAGVAVPASVLDASGRQSLIALGAMTLVLLAIGGGGTYVISRRIANDISRSASDAEAIAAGGTAALARSRVTEVQRLLDALGRSARLIAMRERERDEQVARADTARAEAEAADRAKDQFLAMLGHELRNPLAPALTALHLMKTRGGEAVREREILERQIRHMARLVDDLLDVARMRRGAIELRRERIDVAESIARAIEMTTPAFVEKHHDLRVDVATGLVIDADRIRIAQVLSNLLSNAAKYTPPGGRIELRASAADGFAVIECRDNGSGMPPDLVPHVFDLFVQGERGLDRRDGGLGLGLAVARTLVELHGGAIEAHSDGPHQGSRFVVRLPLAPAAADSTRGSSRPARVPPASREIGRILVVDDNRDALDTLLSALADSGLDAIGASSAAEALEVAARARPRIALLDVGLPDMNGFDLARALRAKTYGARIRLIALTGYGREQDMAAARAAGFDAFFVKPVDIPMLLDALSAPLV
jgi:signal transduction histidine kinase